MLNNSHLFTAFFKDDPFWQVIDELNDILNVTNERKINMRPRNTLVTVAKIKRNKKRKSGNIYLPDDANGKYQLCEIIAVGPGMIDLTDSVSLCVDLKPTMKVIVQLMQQGGRTSEISGLPVMETAGIDLKTFDGRAIHIVDQTQIMAILDPEDMDGGDDEEPKIILD